MLADWYFCCCIDAPPKLAATFLSILDVLEDRSADLSLRVAAIDQLRRCDVWMRAYALPTVLSGMSAADSLLPNHSCQSVYLRELLEAAPEDMAGALGTLIDACVTSLPLSATDFNNAVTVAFDGPTRNPSDIPYLDLREYLPELIILAIYANRLSRDRSRYSPMATIADPHTSEPLCCLLSGAVSGRYGRLAFLIATEISGAVGNDDTRRQLSRRLWSTKDSGSEPDILLAYAKLLYAPLGLTSASTMRGLVAELLDEAVLLSEFRAGADGRSVFRSRILVEGNESVCRVLPIVFWQATLYEMAIALDAEAAAVHLGRLWTPRWGRYPTLSVAGPIGDTAELHSWKDQLDGLFALSWPGQRARMSIVVSSSRVLQNDQSIAAVVSPWMIADTKTSYYEWRRYSAVSNRAALCRLLIAIIVCARLLRTLGSSHPTAVFAARLVAHGSDVLLGFSKWFKKHDTEQAGEIKHSLPPLWTSFALFANAQAGLAGRGHVDSVEPAVVAELLRPGVTGGVMSDQERVFRTASVPAVLTQWVFDGFSGIVDDSGPARWLPYLPDLYNSLPQGLTSNTRVLCAVLTRFLRPDVVLDINLAWRLATDRHDGHALQWTVNHRQLFLVRGLPALQWLQPNWADPDPARFPAQLAVRAVERRSSLNQPFGLEQDLIGRWQRDWLDELGDVGDLPELDRFLRARLVELIEEPCLVSAENEQAVIAMLILDYGSHYDLQRLFNVLFPFDEHGHLKQPPTRARENVRRQFLEALVRYRGRAQSSAQDHSEPQTPREFVRDGRRLDLIERLLWRLAVPGRTAESEYEAATRNLLDALCRRTRVSGLGEPVRVIGAIETIEEKQGLLWDDPDKSPRPWELRAIFCDWTKRTVRAMVQERRIGDASILFDWSRTAVQQFEGAPPSDRIHRVIAIVIDEYPEADRHVYVLNCGLKEPLRGRMPRQHAADGSRIEVGEVVAVEIRRMQGTDAHYWRVLPGLYGLPSATPSNMPARVRIQPRAFNSFNSSAFDVIHAITGEVLRVDPNDWDADLSRGHSGVPLPTGAIAVQELGRWIPVEKSALEMLLAFRGEGKQSFVAVYLGVEQTTAGRQQYRLSLGAGENYIIPSEMFSTEDMHAIDRFVSQLSDPRGLLICVSCAVTRDGARLSLWQHSPDNATALRYPGLSTPFDRRNLAWRDLDQAIESPIAIRQRGEWIVDVSNESGPPFPTRIPVVLIPSPKRLESEVEFNPTAWDCRTGTLRGEPITYHSLSEPTDGKETFVARWIGCGKGDYVVLRRAFPKMSADLVLCLTQEGAAVFAEPDSLTMRAYPTSAFGSDFYRFAQISNHPEWKQVGPTFHVPPSAVPESGDGAGVVGVLASAPQFTEGAGSLCSVWWRTLSGVISAPFPIDEFARDERFSSVRLHPGMRVTAFADRLGWRVRFESRLLKVRALWRCVSSEQCGAGATVAYLGLAYFNGARRHIAEVLPGEVLCLEGPLKANHLAVGTGTAFIGGIPEGERVIELGKGPIWTEGGARFRASRLRVSGGVVYGVAREITPETGEFIAAKVALRAVDGEYFPIRREFVVSTPVQEAATQLLDEQGRLERELQEYLERPSTLSVTVTRVRGTSAVQLQRFRIPSPDGRGWTSAIDVASGHGAYLTGIEYPREGVVRILETDEGFRASFRQPPALTLEEYRNSILGAEMYEIVVLAERLYYVGEEPFAKGYHRFEWRYGCTLLAHERELSFNGGPFADARGVLFPGDSITQLHFLPGSEEDQPSIIAIDQVNVELAETTVLYRQQRDVGVVHVLNLEYGDAEVKITSIIGCADGSSDDKAVFEQLRTAHLDYSDQAALLASASRQGVQASQHAEVILGRLDGEHFLNTLGQEVVFRHVRMAFQSATQLTGRGLKDGELIFMRAGGIASVRNDVALELLPYPGLRSEDISPEWVGIRLLRRRFSVRDDLLPQLLTRSGKDACSGTIYLVRVNRGSDRIHLSIVDVPPRRLRALAAAIDESRAPLLATIMAIHDSKLMIELQPGLFFALPLDRVEYPEGAFEKGTCVRVKRFQGDKSSRYFLVRAAMSDERYVPTSGRPAIALPKNVLFREVPPPDVSSRPRFWEGPSNSRSKCFTIAGLPGIETVPGSLSGSPTRWGPPDPEQFTAMMRRPHPLREVLLGRDDRDFRIAPLSSEGFAVGSLSLDDAPVFRPSESRLNERTESLMWSAVSFLDGSITEIRAHAEAYAWSVHDTQSGVWRNATVEWQRLEPHTFKNGPLFFSRNERGLRLRYNAEEFRTFGYPVQELIDRLASVPNQTLEFPVAGTSSAGGLWVELAPGRIAELPGQLVTLPVFTAGGLSLSHLAWQAFAPGDQVVLQLAPDRGSRIDLVVLREWRPGVRGLLGSGRCFLPVQGFDGDDGRLDLGAGAATLRVPANEALPASVLLLQPNNTLLPPGENRLSPGDTVLLGLENRIVVVLGFPGMIPLPDREREASWSGDPLADDVMRHLTLLVDAVGGALPVTVEVIVQKNNVMYCSRRKQRKDSAIPAGAISLGSLLGSIGDSLLVRCGSELAKIPLQDALPGIPGGVGAAVVNALNAQNQKVWVRRIEDNLPVSVGFAPENSRQFDVEGVCVLVGDSRKGRISGVICRSSRTLSLHWLPNDECAWAQLDDSELDHVIPSQPGRTIAVRRLYEDRPGPVTMTGVLSVRKEFDRLNPGNIFDARLIQPRKTSGNTGTPRWLAVASGLECCWNA